MTAQNRVSKVTVTRGLIAATLVFSLFTSRATEAAIMGYWKLDETSAPGAGGVADSSANGWNGTLATAGGGTTPTVNEQGVIGRAYHFYGNRTQGSGIQVAGFNPSGMTRFTLSGWFYIDTAWNGTAFQPRLMQGYSNQPTFGIGDTKDNGASPASTRAYVDYSAGFLDQPTGLSFFQRTWYLATATYDGTGTKLYIDGTLVKSNTDGIGGGTFSSGGGMFISGAGNGTLGGNSSMDGRMDDVGVLNTALTATQVKALYNTPLFAPLGAASNGHYGLDDMLSLFGAYDSQGSVTIGGLTWNYDANLTGTAGTAGSSGNGYYLVLGANGTGGLVTSAIPEPSSIVLLAIGGAVGLAFAARRRKAKNL